MMECLDIIPDWGTYKIISREMHNYSLHLLAIQKACMVDRSGSGKMQRHGQMIRATPTLREWHSSWPKKHWKHCWNVNLTTKDLRTLGLIPSI